jgi:hypothetical protein
MLSCNSDTFGFKLFDCTDDEQSVNAFIELLQKPAVQTIFQLMVDNAIAVSELKILKRLSAIETVLGMSEPDDEVTTIPQKLTEIEDKVNALGEIRKFNREPAVQPRTTLEAKACKLVDHLKTEVPERNGEIFLNSKEIVHYLKDEISETLRLKDIKNPRQAKKDVIEKAKSLFPNLVELKKRAHGNKNVSIILKPYGCVHTPA